MTTLLTRLVVTGLVTLVTWTTGQATWAQAARFKLDPTHTAIIFGVSHLGMSHTYGRFNTIVGEFTYDANKPESSTFKVEIDANSIDSGNEKRDEHLRGPDFFNVKQFPKIEFVSTRVEPTAEGLNVFGKLTMHGETKEVMIPFQKVGEGDTPFRDYRIGFSTQLTVQRSQFGMTGMLQGIGDDVALTISFEGIRQ